MPSGGQSRSVPARTAVLIDGDWIIGRNRKQAESSAVADFVAILRAEFGRRAIIRLVISAGGRTTESVLTAARDAGAEIIAVPLKGLGRPANVDVYLALESMDLPSDVDRLVLVSGDGDFVPVVERARRRGVRTVVAALALESSAALITAAEEYVDLASLAELHGEDRASGDQEERLVGLVSPNTRAASFVRLRRHIAAARHKITVIDNYVDVDVVTLLLNAPPDATLTIVSGRDDPEVRLLVRRMHEDGRKVALYRNRAAHDRWLSVDGRWWHSGGSFKDLGHRYSRIAEIQDPEELRELGSMESELTKSRCRVFPA